MSTTYDRSMVQTAERVQTRELDNDEVADALLRLARNGGIPFNGTNVPGMPLITREAIVGAIEELPQGPHRLAITVALGFLNPIVDSLEERRRMTAKLLHKSLSTIFRYERAGARELAWLIRSRYYGGDELVGKWLWVDGSGEAFEAIERPSWLDL